MYNYTSLIGMRVMSVHNCTDEGYVTDIIFDPKMSRAQKLVVIDDALETDRVLSIADILNVGSDYIIIRNSSKLAVTPQENNSGIINKQAVDLAGNQLGKITDIVLADNFVCEKILAGEREFLPKQLINAGTKHVIFNLSDKRVSLGNFAPKIKIPVTAQTTQLVTVQAQSVPPSFPTTPMRVTTNTVAIIGKRLSKDLYTRNKEMLAPKNTVITASLITAAKRYDILGELVANIK